MTLNKAIGVIDAPSNRKQIAKIEEAGMTVLRFPELIVSRASNPHEVLGSHGALTDFDWIVFEDIYAADFFLETLHESETDLFVLDSLIVCGLGEAVVDRLRFVQVHTDVIPPRRDDQTVLETIGNYVFDDDAFRSSRLLYIKGENSGNTLSEKLGSMVREIVSVNIYTDGGIAGLDRSRLMTLLRSGAIDEFRFYSPEDVESILAISKPDSIVRTLDGINISSGDAVTFQTLRENGLTPVLKNSW
ncbi:MAG: uroporphyrinogen-III synthase [Acidobacteria bacterium]|nr:uroporphyrinogen-III synthase [Acidobacteriota bacterium]